MTKTKQKETPKAPPQLERREQILRAAAHLISVDRQEQYGSPALMFETTKRFMDAFTYGRTMGGDKDAIFQAEDMAIFNICQKLARLACGKPSADTCIDIAGYIALYAEVLDV